MGERRIVERASVDQRAVDGLQREKEQDRGESETGGKSDEASAAGKHCLHEHGERDQPAAIDPRDCVRSVTARNSTTQKAPAARAHGRRELATHSASGTPIALIAPSPLW